METDTVFLFDVDNTLLDNDQLTGDLDRHIRQQFGDDCRNRYFDIFEELRSELGYADYLGAIQRYRIEHPLDPSWYEMSEFLIDYPFADRLYPDALAAIAHCHQWGKCVIVSDGDVVFQPRKVHRSGIARAVDGILIYIHKEEVLDDVERRFPAAHYVFCDDKPRLYAAIKKHWRERVTTVFPRQGHYAMDVEQVRNFPPPDIAIEHIGDLLELDYERLRREYPFTR